MRNHLYYILTFFTPMLFMFLDSCFIVWVDGSWMYLFYRLFPLSVQSLLNFKIHIYYKVCILLFFTLFPLNMFFFQDREWFKYRFFKIDFGFRRLWFKGYATGILYKTAKNSKLCLHVYTLYTIYHVYICCATIWIVSLSTKFSVVWE